MMEFFSGATRGVLVGTTVHIIKGQSSFALFIGETRYGYCCQDGCHDRGLRDDVRKVVAKAKEAGATHVMVRTGQNSYRVEHIAGLPVLDVAYHTGRIDETTEITRRFGGNDPGPNPEQVRYEKLTVEYLTLCLQPEAERDTERFEQIRTELRSFDNNER